MNATFHEDVIFQCGALSVAAAEVPTSVHDIVGQDLWIFSQYAFASLEIPKLRAASTYDIYCITRSADNTRVIQTSFESMMENRITASTQCCRIIRVKLKSVEVSHEVGAIDILEIEVDFLPSDNPLELHVGAYFSPNSSITKVKVPSPFIPFKFQLFPGDVGKMLTASLPSQMLSGLYSINVTVSGTGSAHFRVEYEVDRASFSVAENLVPLPPNISFSRQSNDGTHTIVRFDRRVDQSYFGTIFACSEILVFNSSKAASCQWVSDDTVAIYHDQSYYVNPGDKLTLLSNIMLSHCGGPISLCNQRSYSSSQITVVEPAVAPFRPVVSISASDIVGPCDLFVLDLTLSTHDGGRSWSSVSISVSSETANVTRLNNFFDNEYVISPPEPVPIGFFESPNEYIISVVLCNYMGKCSDELLHFVSSIEVIKPVIRLSGVPTRMTRSDTLEISTNAFVSQCNGVYSTKDLEFYWRIYASNGLNDTSLIHLFSSSYVYTLPKYSLNVSTYYSVEVTVTYTRSMEEAASAISFYVKGSGIVAILLGGQRRSLPQGQMLTLDASFSYDNDMPWLTGKEAGLSFLWSCSMLDPPSENSCGIDMINESTEELMTIFAKNSSVIGSTSKIKVQIRDSTSRIDEASVLVEVVPGFSPIIEILSSKTTITITEKLKLFSSCESFEKEQLLSWSIDDPLVDLKNVSSTETERYVPPGIHSFNLGLPQRILHPRSAYTFTLSASQSKSTVTVKVISAPQSGTFSINPSSGVAMVDTFTLSTTLWVDIELPLSYSFGYMSSLTQSTKVFLLLRKRSEMTFAFSKLPHSSDNFNELECSVTAFNSLDASSSLQERVVVNPFNLSLPHITDRVIGELNATSEETDPNILLSAITIGTTTLNNVDCSKISNCSEYYRSECSSLANTCGPCLTSYYGEEGSHNSICLSTSNSKVDGALNEICSDSSECTGFQECSAEFRCYFPSKKCDNNCSGNGICDYVLSFSGEPTKSCHVGDSTCTAKCLCFEGYSGKACTLMDSDKLKKQEVRERLAISLTDFVSANGATSSESITALVNMLFQLSQVSNELTISSCSRLVYLVNVSLVNAAAQKLSLTEVENVIHVLDQCQDVASEFEISHRSLTTGNDTTASVETFLLSEIIQQLIVVFTNFIMTDLVNGERAVEFVQKNYRTATVLASSALSGGNITNTTIISSYVTITSALSVYEQQDGRAPSEVTVRLDSSSSTLQQHNPPPAIGLSIIETSAQVFLSEDPDNFESLVSNPMKVVISQELSDHVVTQRPISVLFTFVNPVAQSYGEEIKANETFSSDCATGSYVTYNYTCGNGAVIKHDCHGAKSKLTKVTACPSSFFRPVCRRLVEGKLDPANDNCAMVNFTAHSTICECDIGTTSTIRRRKLSTTMEETGIVEVCAMSAFVVDDFTSTIVTSTQWNKESLKRSFAVLLLFILLWATGAALFLFISSDAYRERFKDSLTSKNREIKKKLSVTNEDKKRFVLNYIDEIFPEVFIKSSWSWNGFRYVLRQYHRHYYLFINDEPNARWDNMTTILELLTSHTLVFFIIAVTWGLQFPSDDGTCEVHETKSRCLEEKSMFDSALSKCTWEAFETVNGVDIYHCEFSPVVLTLRSMMLIIVVMTLAQEFFQIPIDAIFNQVIRAPLFNDVADIIRKVDLHGDYDEELLPKSKSEYVPVEMIGSGIASKFSCSMPFARRFRNLFFIEDVTTRQLPDHMMAVHSDVTKIVFEEKKDMENVLVQNYDVGATDNEEKGMKFTYSELISNIVAQREVLMDRNPKEVDFFDNEWGWDHLAGDFKTSDYEDGGRGCLQKKVPLSTKVHADLEEATRITQLKLRKLRQSLDAHKGLEIIHLFILDLLGRDTAAAKIFRSKTEVDFRHGFVVTSFAKFAAWSCIAALNVFFVYYCILTAARRDYLFQGTFVVACSLQLFFEIVVFETVEIAWVHYILPHLAAKDIRQAIFELKKHVDSAFSVKLSKIENPLDASEYFFASARLAKHFPDLFESSIILIYAHYLPGVIGNRWFCRPTSFYDANTRNFLHGSISLNDKLRALGHIVGTFPIQLQTFLIHFFQPIFCFFAVAFVLWTVEEPLLMLIPAAIVAFEYIQHWRRHNRTEQSVVPIDNDHEESDDYIDKLNSAKHDEKVFGSVQSEQHTCIRMSQVEKASCDMAFISDLAHSDKVSNFSTF